MDHATRLSRLALAYQKCFSDETGQRLSPWGELVVYDIVMKYGRYTQVADRSSTDADLRWNEGARSVAERVYAMLRLDVGRLFEIAVRERQVEEANSEDD